MTGKNKDDLEIRYLAFEGGGGRGAAYIGAVKALQHQNVIAYKEISTKSSNRVKTLDTNKIKGISGTSAGAITAALLAAGYDYKFFIKMLTSETPLQFFDNAAFLKCPVLPFEKPKFNGLQLFDNLKGKAMKFKDMAKTFSLAGIAGLLKRKRAASILASYLGDYTSDDSFPYVFEKIRQKPGSYLVSLMWDMGLFTGMAIRAWIDRCLYEATGQWNITFKMFNELTKDSGQGLHLKIAGVCLNTAEVVWFDHLGPWKHLPIADAVRISLSIPGFFKPVAISRKQPKNGIDLEKALLFVDGGVLNNTPIHAFDTINEEESAVGKAEEYLFGIKARLPNKVLPLNKEVLGLRLIDPSEGRIQWFSNGVSMFGGVLNALMSQSERNQIRTTGEAKQTIELDTSGLNILEFTVDSDKMTKKCDDIFNYTDNWLSKKWKGRMQKEY